MNAFKKHLGKYIDYEISKRSMVFALSYCLLFNTSVFMFRFNNLELSGFLSIIELSKDFICLNIMLFIFFFGLSLHRWVFIILSLFMFITGALASYYLFYFDIVPSYRMMPKLYDTDFSDIYDAMTIRLGVWIVFSIAIFMFAYKHFKAEASKLFFSKILSAVCLLILINSIISPPFGFMQNYFPTQYLHNSFKHFFGEAT